MIVKDIEELRGTEYEVKAKNWTSTRILLKKDGMGFSFHETIIHAGTETKMQYLNHLESVYCVEGTGTLIDLSNDQIYQIKQGVIYALDQHDLHILKAETDLRLLCVFNPPCTGKEVHDENGAYPLLKD